MNNLLFTYSVVKLMIFFVFSSIILQMDPDHIHVVSCQSTKIDDHLKSQQSSSACHYSCEFCTNQTVKGCTSCNETMKRQFKTNRCKCMDGYYDRGYEKCIKCRPSCLTCLGSNNCVTCPKNSNRTLIENRCVCQEGYFDNGKDVLCKKCNVICKRCLYDAKACLTCNQPEKYNRQFTGRRCDCRSGYYDNGEDECASCNNSCLECDGPTSNQCSICHDYDTYHRVLQGTACVCFGIGYFQFENDPVCQQCHPRCKQCTGKNRDQCTACFDNQHSYFKQNQCLCEELYLQADESAQCEYCMPVCLHCVPSKPGSRYIDPICFCDQKCQEIHTNQETLNNKLISLFNQFTTAGFVNGVINIWQPLGMVSLLSNSPQILLLLNSLNYHTPTLIHNFKRILMLFYTPVRIAFNQSEPFRTELSDYWVLNCTELAFEGQKNDRFRLVGVSYNVIASTALKLIIFMTMTLFYVMANKSLFKKLPIIPKIIYKVSHTILHATIDGSLFWLFTSMLYSITQLQSQSGGLFIASVVISFTSILGLSLYLVMVSKDIDRFVRAYKPLHPSSQQLDQFQAREDLRPFKESHFFLTKKIRIDSRWQSHFPIISQVRKFLLAIIVVFGTDYPIAQFAMIFLAQLSQLVLALIVMPYEYKGFTYLDITLQVLLLVYIAITVHDYQSSSVNTNISGYESFITGLVIIGIDIVRNLTFLASWFNEYIQRYPVSKDYEGAPFDTHIQSDGRILADEHSRSSMKPSNNSQME